MFYTIEQYTENHAVLLQRKLFGIRSKSVMEGTPGQCAKYIARRHGISSKNRRVKINLSMTVNYH